MLASIFRLIFMKTATSPALEALITMKSPPVGVVRLYRIRHADYRLPWCHDVSLPVQEKLGSIPMSVAGFDARLVSIINDACAESDAHSALHDAAPAECFCYFPHF